MKIVLYLIAMSLVTSALALGLGWVAMPPKAFVVFLFLSLGYSAFVDARILADKKVKKEKEVVSQ